MRIRWARWLAAILLWSALGALFTLPGLSAGNVKRALLALSFNGGPGTWLHIAVSDRCLG
jgi:hypothetical protein